jgi:hypothetical protein
MKTAGQTNPRKNKSKKYTVHRRGNLPPIVTIRDVAGTVFNLLNDMY